MLTEINGKINFNKMKVLNRLSLIFFVLVPFISFSQSILKKYKSPTTNNQKGWAVTKPFQRDVFIENNGQFSDQEKKDVGDKIIYYTHKGGLYLYFTRTGLVLRRDTVYKTEDNQSEIGDEKEDGMRNLRVKHQFTKMQWVGCNPDASLEVENETPDYFTFPNHSDQSGKSGIMAHGWTRLTYKNLYYGIDVEFYYPENKGGIEYSLIVHPGADPSLVKILYSGSTILKSGKNIKINAGWDVFTDHEPNAKDADGKSINCAFQIEANTISFNIGNYDKSQTLVIDPWITATTLGGVNLAYDLGYDYLGNVYVYGGGINNYYELQKYNSTGALQWTYVNNAFSYQYSGGYFYGGLTVDHLTGTSYMCEGYDFPDKVVKVNYNGLQAALYPGAGTDEMWRIGYDYCNNQLILDIGGTPSSQQAATMDTNLTTETGVNILNTATIWDQVLLGFDNVGNCYAGTSQMIFGTGYSDLLCKMPLPSLAPTAYTVYDHHYFLEISNITYYPVLSIYVVGNGFNGLAATPTFVVTYDGKTMRQWNAANGALIDSAHVSGTANAWGGLDIDCQGHIYCGNNNSVSIYDSNMNSLGNIPLSNTVYDVLVAPNGNIYACGNGFVQCVSGATKMATITSTPAGCGCSGSATVNTCGDGPFTYLWSNGATTQSITGQCSGSYTVTVTAGKCLKMTDTASVNLGSGGGFAATVATVNAVCTTDGSATANPTGGHPPYTYFWSNGNTTSSTTGLPAGNYYLLITDNTGCKDSLLFSITNTPDNLAGTVTTINPSCSAGGSATAVPTGGNPPYTYLWSNSTTTVTDNGLSAGSYYVLITDNTGCVDSIAFTLTGAGVPIVTITPSIDTVCNGGGDTLKASGALTYTWLPVTGLSCTSCPNPKASPLVTTTYTVTGDSNGCIATASATVTVLPPPTIVAGASPDTVCEGHQSTLSAKGGVSYTWAPSTFLSCTSCLNPIATPTTEITYTVIGTDAHGCTNSGTITVYVAPTPVLTVSPNKDICPGQSAVLTASGSGSGFIWEPGNSTSQSITVSPVTTTIYTVTLTGGCGTTQENVTVTVNPMPVPDISADLTSGCYPLCIQFRNKTTVASGNVEAYSWNFGTGDSSNRETPIYCYPNSGNFTVDMTATSDSGCSATIKVLNMITVYSHPDAAFTVSPQPTTIIEPTIQFTDKSTDVYGLSYWVWNFGVPGDDTLSTLENPSYTYPDTGTYCPSLVVMNNHGCVDTVSNCLVIGPLYALYIPDAFSPNGDGLNDVFIAKGNDIKSFEMYIFDRWGSELFHSTDINNGWNGTVKGGNTICQEDTYVYLIKATDSKNTDHSYTGKVTLIK
jgi:gliding motility-associated-like protein